MRFMAAAGLVMLLSGLGSYYATSQLSAFSIANLIAGPVALIVTGIIQSRRIRGFSGVHSRRVVLRWTAVCTAVLIAVVISNVLASGWSQRIDLTVERSFTLSDQSLDLCAEFASGTQDQRPLLLLFEDAKLARDVRLLISAYESSCELDARELLRVEAPPEAQAVLSSFETTVVACWTGRCEPVGYPSEENISSALLRLVRSSSPTAYFLIGHGEANFASESDLGFSGFAASLRQEGIEIRVLIGPSVKEIPEDAELVVVANPERQLLQAELDALDRYLQRGGRMLVLLEPNSSSNIQELLERWGFGLPAGVIADRITSPLLESPRPVSLLVNRFSTSHPVTRKMSRRTLLLMPTARAVIPARKPEPQDRLTGLVFSSPGSWLESDVSGAYQGRELRRDADEIGGREIPIAAAGRYPRTGGEARLVVLGDRDFASNRLVSSLYNRDLFMNAVLWLAEDEARIAIRPKLWTRDQDPLTLQQTVAYFYFMAFALPEILLLLGIRAWYQQKT